MPDRSAARWWTVLAAGALLLLTAIYVSLTSGTFDMSVKEVVTTLLRISPSPEHDLVVFEFRLPRIVIAALVGFGLGIAGAVLQGVTRNGLADPGMLGINAGAGAGIVLFIFLYSGKIRGLGWESVMLMPLFGFIGGLLAVALIFALARERGRLDSQRLLLTGIAIGSGFGALTLYLSLKMSPTDFEMATVWLAGSIYNANWTFIVSMLPWLLVLTPLLWSRVYVLDLFQLEEESTKSVGVATEREKYVLLLGSVGIVSACVAVSGSIGFVGLLAPHIARRLVGIRHRRLFPVCGLIGMLLVVIGDLIGKTVFAPSQLAVGIVISLIGVPYFIYLLFKSRA